MKRSKFIKQAGALGAALAMTATPVMAATDPAAIEPVPGPLFHKEIPLHPW